MLTDFPVQDVVFLVGLIIAFGLGFLGGQSR